MQRLIESGLMTDTTFRQMMVRLRDRIGSHHLPVRHDASEIHDFLDNGAVHHDLVKRVINDVYRANRCGHLDAAVSLTSTFSALGLIRGDTIRSGRCDVDQLGLLEELGAQIADLFTVPGSPGSSSTAPEAGATVLPLTPNRTHPAARPLR